MIKVPLIMMKLLGFCGNLREQGLQYVQRFPGVVVFDAEDIGLNHARATCHKKLKGRSC